MPRRLLKRRRQVADAQLAHVEIGVPVERQIDHAQILFVGPGDRVKDQRAVLDRPAQRPDPILGPRQRHRAVAADAAERGTQPGDAADRGRRENRSARFGADAEGDAAGRRRTRRAGRRSARSFRRIPRAVGPSAEPLISGRQFSGRQLREHHRAGFTQQTHDRRFGVDHLAPERARSPLRREARDRDDVLAAPRHAVQRSAILAGGDLAVGLLRLTHRQFVGVGDDEIERGVEAAEAIEIHAGQLDRRHLARLEQLREVRERPERDVLEAGGAAQRRRRAGAQRLHRAIEPRARHERAVVERRRNVRIDRDLPQVGVAREVLVDAGEHLLPLLVGEIEPGDGERVLEHRVGDALGLDLLDPRPQHAGQERRRQADAREIGDESSSGGGRVGHTRQMLSPDGGLTTTND